MGLTFLTIAASARAQISPGELARAHESLEGMSNCLKCHELGSGPSAEKCLDCHREIAAAVAGGRGYHFQMVSEESRLCFECHKDHAGRTFELVHWPGGREQFDHAQAGWPLAGAHAAVACRKCHQADHLTAQFKRAFPDVNGDRTYLGLGRDCAGCHTDPHAGQFEQDCAACHGTSAWKPASQFDHAATAFPLRGRHAQLECAQCHRADTTDERMTIRYTGIATAGCAGCHNDPHQGRFGPDCASCHGDNAWKPVTGFDHSKTSYPLTGAHAGVSCEKCHGSGSEQRYAGLPHENCTSCHTDPHENRLGPDCASCHNTAAWKNVPMGGKAGGGAFDHARTRFPLEGRHASVQCERCHTGASKTAGLAFDTCERCHRDVHEGQFAAGPGGGACERCHDVNGFVPARYTAVDHERSRFPLTGAHLAMPCVACHRAQDSGARRFVFADLGCEACHDDPHAAQFTARAPAKSCDQCHRTASWHELAFDHDRDSKYRLQGQHRLVPCFGCHTAQATGVVRYRPLPASCEACHSVQPARLGES